MYRHWKPILLAAGLLALPPAAWGQVAPPVPPPPAAAPPPPVPARIVVAGERDGFFFRAPAVVPQPAAGLRVTAETGDEGAFFLAQAAAPGAAPQVRVVQEQVDPKALAGGEFWIGVQLEPLPELVKSQLQLERGMVVVHVFDDSPAAKAEFKINDILLRAGDKDIVGPEDLIHAVNEAKDKELAIRALRGGSETTLKVTPARRQADRIELQVSPETPHAEVVRALEELYKKTPDGDVRLFALRPGGVFAFAQAEKFPGNLEVTIEKRGDKPATIRVKRIQDGEDKTWEVTEDKIDELPEDVRPHVQQMLGGQVLAAPQHLQLRIEEARARAQDQAAQANAKMREAQQHLDRTLREYKVRVRPMAPGAAPGPAPPVAPPLRITRLPGAGDSSIQAKLDEILRKLDQPQSDSLQRLQREVERLRRDLEELRQEKK
jgi:hypothetical protein